MNSKLQPTLQNAVAAGLNLLADPEVRIPANQVEGVAALRMLLTAIASGQLVVSEPAPPAPAPTAAAPEAYPKPKMPRKPKPKVNGAEAPAAPTTVQ